MKRKMNGGSFLLLAVLAVAQLPSPAEAQMNLSAERASLKKELTDKYGTAQKARIDRGIDQAAALWQDGDGDFSAFVREQFIADPALLDKTLGRMEYALEMLDGHENEIGRELRRATDLDVGPLLGVDPLLSAFDASAHVTEDLFKSKIGFVVLLNFPLTTLAERLAGGTSYSRQQWAEARLAGRFARRIPGEVQQAASTAGAQAELYIAEYNIWMHHLISDDKPGTRLFPKGLRLISHWNLRDELKADYADPKARDKQRTIIKVMERIVTQTIPRAVINNPRVDWNPFTNAVTVAPAAEIESDAPQLLQHTEPVIDAKPEPDTRYERLLAQFHAAQLADPYTPITPTAIARSFELQREISEERVTAMLREILESKLVPQVSAIIESRLHRKLQPQDLWYNGFQSRAKFSESELDAQTQKKYPTAEAFAKDIPRILTTLGFSPEKAQFLSSHIVVDPARGAGHALQSARRGDFPHLRTRVEAGGMNYKGYNIAVHELGHNVEQVFSLYEVDRTLLASVPNNAFTEALAFVFQAKDLELLGLAKPDAESEHLRTLNDFWQTWEIAGVALVDIAVWHWMYAHPNAKAAELREAVVSIARETWNRYYAKILGDKDTPLLGIYSHMISYPLYLCDYPLGHLIAFQIEEQMKKAAATGIPLGAEFERMAKFGSVTPDLWMENATGAKVGAGPLLRATANAVHGMKH